MPELKGDLHIENASFAIIVSRFNESITKNLLHSAVDTLKRSGAEEKDITIVWVPGAYEIPLTANALANTGKYQAIICLGAVIRGATPHFEYVAGQTSSGIMQVSLNTGIPIVFGVLTTENIEQAIERSGTKAGNKGFDAAQSAIEMANLMKIIPPSQTEKTKERIDEKIKIKNLLE